MSYLVNEVGPEKRLEVLVGKALQVRINRKTADRLNRVKIYFTFLNLVPSQIKVHSKLKYKNQEDLK